MQCFNDVHLAGIITKTYPIKHFSPTSCMLIVEVKTIDESGEFTHRLSLVNDQAIAFSESIQIGQFVEFFASLRPRPKFKDQPNGETFFEIRCNKFIADPIAVLQTNQQEAINNELFDFNEQPQPPVHFELEQEVAKSGPQELFNSQPTNPMPLPSAADSNQVEDKPQSKIKQMFNKFKPQARSESVAAQIPEFKTSFYAGK